MTQTIYAKPVSEDRAFMAGSSPTVLTLKSVIAEIAPTSIPVLLVGESGTGKQMFAQLIHRLSPRTDEPFVKVACAAMNPERMSAELGLVPVSGRQAAGTVFLDEISELDAACQRSLLYALPEEDSRQSPGRFTARVIATTNRNLDEEMRAGRFRSELYYRINGVCLRLPPLRERKDDIPLFADFFLRKHAAQFGRQRPSLGPGTLQIFMDHSWPGNIRELENVIKKIVALNDEELAIAELVQAPLVAGPRPAESQGSSLKAAARAASREAERELILKALARTRWNRKRAARDLQISYKSLLYKLKQIGLEDTEAV
jgi:two-component system, NtrC family, response regulator AtoC